MRRGNLFVLCLIFFQIPLETVAQFSEKYATRFSQYYNYLHTESPAAAPFDSQYDLNIGQQNYLGSFSIVRTLFGTANLTTTTANGNKHSFGVLFTSNKEGDLLSFTRGYLQYGYQLQLSTTTKLSAGAKVGFAKFLAEETATSRFISSNSKNMGVGIELKTPTSTVGLALSQVPTSKLKADLETFTLSTYISAYAQRTVTVTPEVDLQFSAIGRLMKNSNYNSDLTLLGNFYKLLLLGTGYGTGLGRGVNYHLGVKDYELFEGKITAILSYNTSFLSQYVGNLQTMEVSIRYSMPQRTILVLEEDY